MRLKQEAEPPVKEEIFDTKKQEILPQNTEAPNEPIPDGMTSEAWKRFLVYHEAGKESNASINFYGRVVDQLDQPLEGVQVVAVISSYYESLVDRILQGATEDEVGRINTDEIAVVTDSNGLFSYEAYNGRALRIISLEKEGFVSPKLDEGSFSFGNNYTEKQKSNIPTTSSPRVYTMWKKGLPQDLVKNKTGLKFDANGTVRKVPLFSSSRLSDLYLNVSVLSDLDAESTSS